MNSEQKIKMLEEEVKGLKETLNHMQFRQRLLFDQTPVNRLLFEYEITQTQYNKIMDLMDFYRSKIGRNEKVHHSSFEQSIYQIVPKLNGNYHFVEFLTNAFKEESRWEEVFDKLYGDMPKYRNNF
ncbi:DUF1878 domain-containing protein [Halobacillus sp. GSS1]|uniref:DUF1878 domain-containing protein n=1 Tax=Halobacillus sp. GSS1 TaxID=2815919 RepID=UPI001A90320A|nr:DUF1878 domain-containing protein [Halobacillus sp. GSS1]MBN9653871.1 DUF1878 domain-containing protein [Halobacillus sp. GSS1]